MIHLIEKFNGGSIQLESHLNQRSKNGWELVSFQRHTEYKWTLIFKHEEKNHES